MTWDGKIDKDGTLCLWHHGTKRKTGPRFQRCKQSGQGAGASGLEPQNFRGWGFSSLSTKRESHDPRDGTTQCGAMRPTAAVFGRSLTVCMPLFQSDRLQKPRNDYLDIAIHGFDVPLQALRFSSNRCRHSTRQRYVPIVVVMDDDRFGTENLDSLGPIIVAVLGEDRDVGF